ncbi:MAG: alpha/beta hydrolase [Cyanobacteria bacterium J083]|nr:MAG: alpha/beta hydrolase [Cyanobacteria bacterium J083]
MTYSSKSIQANQVLWDDVPVIAYQLTCPVGEARTHRVILLHGLGGSANQWFETMKIISAAGHNSIAFDLPGHGKSGLPETHPLTPAWMGEAMARWLEKQPPFPTVLVGHSLGGWVVMRAYLNQPEAIAGIVLVASAGLRGIPLQPPQLDFSQGLAGITQQILNSMFYQPERVEPQILQALLGEAISSYALMSLRPEGLLQPEELQQVSCPVKIIWGEQDRIIPVEWGQVFAKNLPNSSLTILPECGHFPHLELPQLFQQHLLQFLVNLIPS